MKEFKDKKKVLIPCRFSFLHCWEPDSVNGSEPKYSVSAIIPKSDAKTVSRIKAAIEVAKQESIAKWGGKIPPNLKMPLRDGDIDRPDDEAYAGCYFLNANSREKPQIVDKAVQPIITKSISRMFRNTADCLLYTRELKKRGIGVLFEEQNINTLDSTGELMLTILSSLAQDESRNISENTTWGIRSRFQQGHLHLNTNRFLGYCHVLLSIVF